MKRKAGKPADRWAEKKTEKLLRSLSQTRAKSVIGGYSAAAFVYLRGCEWITSGGELEALIKTSGVRWSVNTTGDSFNWGSWSDKSERMLLLLLSDAISWFKLKPEKQNAVSLTFNWFVNLNLSVSERLAGCEEKKNVNINIQVNTLWYVDRWSSVDHRRLLVCRANKEKSISVLVPA